MTMTGNRWKVLAAFTAACLALPALAVTSHPFSSQADSTPAVTVDFATSVRSADHVGEGFLYGLSQSGSGPSDALLSPLQVNLMRGGGARLAGDGWIGDNYQAGTGYKTRIASALGQARRVTTGSYKAEYVLMFNDLWGADLTEPSGSKFPCDNGDCSNWVTFIKQVVSDVKASGLHVTFEPWNEPDNVFWPAGMNTTQYFQMWDTAYKTIRSLDSTARIEGPALFIPNQSTIDTFLQHVKAAGTVPNVLSVHNLENEDPVTVGTMLQSEISSNGLTGVSTSINEYLSSQQLSAGATAWYFSRLVRSGITTASRGIYPQQYSGQLPCCTAGDLGGILVPGSNGAQLPTGQYWTYSTYAQQTGSYLKVTDSSSPDAVVSNDASAKKAVALVGDTTGYTGPVSLNLTNLGSQAWLSSAGSVEVRVVGILDSAPLVQPSTISDTVVPVSSGSITVPLAISQKNEALAVYVTPAPSTGSKYVDSSTTTGANHFTFTNAWKTPGGIPDLFNGTATTPVTPSTTNTMTFSFVGTQARIFGVKDIDQGNSTFSVDGGAATTVNDYSAVRDSQTNLYTTPVLTSGKHTVTITAPGTNVTPSSGTIVAIDYATVTP